MQNDEGQSSQPIHHIVYCSQAAVHMNKGALEKIMTTAKLHNPKFGITGLLVFGSGIFFQWLEGPRDNVTSLFKIISADHRHSDVVLLTREDEFRERLFPNWDMELVIERRGDELLIKPAQRRIGDVLGKFAGFTDDFMAQGRGENMESERDPL